MNISRKHRLILYVVVAVGRCSFQLCTNKCHNERWAEKATFKLVRGFASLECIAG